MVQFSSNFPVLATCHWTDGEAYTSATMSINLKLFWINFTYTWKLKNWIRLFSDYHLHPLWGCSYRCHSKGKEQRQKKTDSDIYIIQIIIVELRLGEYMLHIQYLPENLTIFFCWKMYNCWYFLLLCDTWKFMYLFWREIFWPLSRNIFCPPDGNIFWHLLSPPGHLASAPISQFLEYCNHSLLDLAITSIAILLYPFPFICTVTIFAFCTQ